MNRERTTQATPQWLVERLALGELEAEAVGDVQRRLEAEDGGLARLAAVAASDREILAELPPDVMAKRITQQRQAQRTSERRRRFPWLAIGTPVAAAAAFVLVVAVRQQDAGGPEVTDTGAAEIETTRAKGTGARTPGLVLFRRRGERDEALADGSPARARDLVQVGTVMTEAKFGVVVSIDGRGTVTRHLPAVPGAAVRLAPGRHMLPASYELDDAPEFERFFLIFADQPFAAGSVEAAGKTLARDRDAARRSPLALPAGLAQRSLLLRKVAP